MKRIALITLAGLTFLATAAAAHQNGWANNPMGVNGHMQQSGYTGGTCPMDTNMMGMNMMNGNPVMMGPGMRGNATPGNSTNNWRTNPSYQGQVNDNPTTGK